jgi:hypothetical protein
MEKEPFFDEICSKLNIDSVVKKNAYEQFVDLSRNTILDVSCQDDALALQNIIFIILNRILSVIL